MRHAVAILTLSCSISIVNAQSLPECGTSDARTEQADQLRVWSEARQRLMMSKGAPAPKAAVTRAGTFVLPADESTAPFRHPFDLEGRSLLFSRKDAQTFGRQNVDLTYDDMTGVVKRQPRGATIAYTLAGFTFPFGGRNVSDLQISSFNAIFLGPPKGGENVQQFNDAELAAGSQPVIAPLWTTKAGTGSQYPDVYIKESADRLSISWIATGSAASYDVQATLFRSGDIRFSYKRATQVRAAGLVISTGEEQWRSQQTILGSAQDSAGDVLGNPAPALVPLLDLDSVSVSRVAGTSLIEIRVKTRGALSQLTTETLQYVVFIGDPSLRQAASVVVTKDGTGRYSTPGWGTSDGSPAAHFENDTVVLDLLQENLMGPLDNVSIRAYSQAPGASQFADSVTMTATIDTPQKSVATNYRTLVPDETSGPNLQAFTLPILSVGGVWSAIKEQYGLRDDSIDGLAIYQNFFTDIVLYAGAYSTGGNAGASGIKIGTSLGPGRPLTPALLHMNKIGYGWNATDDNSGHVILHELGHRWLLSVNVMQDGKPVRVLNPVSSHPAQYIHTPAAFPVIASTDASCMGGANFIDNGDGTFSSPVFDNYGYSWLDLYLMGLASKSEVPPWYYITNSNPQLGEAYYPPPSMKYQGVRKDVLIQQVTEAMGDRVPAYPDTQRKFRVLFVLMTDADHPATDADLARVNDYRQFLQKRFALATGGRAEVVTILDVPSPPRRRAAGH